MAVEVLLGGKIIDAAFVGLCFGAARETKQLSIICDKVWDLCERSDFANVKGMMGEFCENLADLQSVSGVKPISSEKVQVEMLRCCRVALPASPCTDEELGTCTLTLPSDIEKCERCSRCQKEGGLSDW